MFLDLFKKFVPFKNDHMIKGMHISLKQHYPKFKPQSKSEEKPGLNPILFLLKNEKRIVSTMMYFERMLNVNLRRLVEMEQNSVLKKRKKCRKT